MLAVVLALALGTYAFRLAGVLLADRLTLPESVRRLLPLAAVALLTALAVTAALTEAGSPAGVARPGGVLVGLILAWRRLPFAVVVVAAAATAAGLRLLGLP
ncbi:AzlD domain-containing protein [Natronosporangium hydrolyticum]|uniref:AzlD domain-containing protein n=2 Tax=Natronosporangium hydrolyticum TaxID=2811111 RepID=A0A895YRK5_9ACTN|nr:AzlD domain-containing protein [Natronosporangium hydrolyticum]QSB17426.1 AzlD domain-containing protein [Natronosporangium hydrolyticum]